MRRGHPGVGGWRGDNQRHFRPRSSGTPHFRPSRPFGSLDGSPRFPPPGQRQFRGPRPYGPPPGHRSDNVSQPEHYDRNKYRLNNLSRSQERGYHNKDRQMPSFNHQMRQNDNDHGGSHSESNFYQNPNQCHVNNMGDIDHRRQLKGPPWGVPPLFDTTRQYYDDHRSPHKTPKHLNFGEDLPDYSGHRPPASDHYTTTTRPNNNNSQYSHSVDDTVDIVRKRLQNRDKQPSFDTDQQSNMDEDLRKSVTENFTEAPQEQPVKKRIQRQKQIATKSHCDKMKNKIVHQLFKMDKMKMHKLMDNPSSSTKFEYAISSLITEGQNSLNKHLRSVAEKSLCSTSTDFIHDDNNTIYEDTFMKQMQGVLDPQDTVLLEDIKPLVMAELSRVLQLDDYQIEAMQDYGMHQHQILDHSMHDQGLQETELLDQGFEIHDSDMRKDAPCRNQYYDDDVYITDHNPQETFYEENLPKTQDNVEIISGDIDDRNYGYGQQSNLVSKPLFERRATNPTKVDCANERRHSENRQSRNSIDNAFGYLHDKPSRDNSSNCAPILLFDPNIEQFSEEDDPFEELDKQYHVAVDRNYMENENASRPSSPQLLYTNSVIPQSFSRPIKTIEVPHVTASSIDITKEIESEVHYIADSPENLFPSVSNNTETESEKNIVGCINEESAPCLEKENLSAERHTVLPSMHEGLVIKKESKKQAEKPHEYGANTKSVLQSNTRKRSTDQKPSHRKEKRKRSSHSDCQESAKSLINIFNTHDDSKEKSRNAKRSNSTEKAYSDKYVKRKSRSKSKNKDSTDFNTYESKKHNSSSHSTLSPKNNLGDETPTKSDPKAKLKPIDMFGDQLKKGNTHQALRNTSQSSIISPDEAKPKPVIPVTITFAKKLSKRHIGTQVLLKVRSNYCQTDKPKRNDRKTQTDPVSINTSKSIANNPLERMKEIDMEIQLLLQEKFKLYNSLETKALTVPMDSMPSLSMRVFKVNTDEVEEKSNDSEDAIVDDFTSIPTEELEQIALETIKDEKSKVKTGKKIQRQKVLAHTRKNSKSPTTKRLNKKIKSPNISLIEQIITDDRPIEDIISLDDLEIAPVKSKKKQQNAIPKKKSSKKSKPLKSIIDTSCGTQLYDIKECSVVLKRINVNKYLRPRVEESLIENNTKIKFESPVIHIDLLEMENSSRHNSDECSQDSDVLQEIPHNEIPEPNLVQVVEDVVNDLQFDMLDVSEDIIIGDNCEVKADDKVNDREVISEEIILDNSQSSIEETVCPTGTENECKTYDYSTNENLRRDAITVTGNGDAVLAIECIDNDFLAACLDGNVYHFSGDDGQLLNTLRGTNQAVTCLTIVQEKYGTTVYTGSLDSRIRYYDLETGLEKGPECNVLSPIQTMDRAWDTIFVGTRTGFVLQFECKNNMLIPVSSVKFSEQSILALRAMKEGPRKVLLVAARSENVVTIKDAQTGLLLRTLQGPKMSVYTLLFEDGKVYCGTSSHNIHVFDYSSGSHVWSHEGGKGAVCLLAAGGLVFAGCYDGCVYVFREGEPRPRAQLRGPSLMLLSLAIRGTKIIAGYKDRGLYIWKLPLAIVQEMIL